MICYCIACYRPAYSRLLIADLVRKTSVPFEILVWVNVDDPLFDAFLEAQREAGAPVVIVGRTPHNVGMGVYRELFRASRYPLVTQIDDDVLCVSRGIAETAARIFAKHRDVRQIVADVWQDELTTGARPPLEGYRHVDAAEGLYDGPIDGWFSIYHRSILPLLVSLPIGGYAGIGAMVKGRLGRSRLRGLLCTRMKVFHAIGPAYASLFDMLDFEIAKYQRLGRAEIVHWYQTEARPPREEIERRYAGIVRALESGENTENAEKTG